MSRGYGTGDPVATRPGRFDRVGDGMIPKRGESSSLSASDHVGEYVGRYFVEECIGHGNVASVYRVRHARLGGSFALKVLHAQNDEMRDALMQEGRAQCELRHQNIVGVSDLLFVDGDPGLVMEYVDGPTLHQFLRDEELGLPETVKLFRQIVRGVAYAHRENWVHRDLKPGNVLLTQTEDGWLPKVCDFGLVKVLGEDGDTEKGLALGTPSYMAPEQIRDAASVDHRADLFSLGCIFYEMVCGTRAFKSNKSAMDVLNKVVAGDYVLPTEIVEDLPQPVEDLIVDLLKTKARKRIQTSEELLERLDAADFLGVERRRPKRTQQTVVPNVAMWSGLLVSILLLLVVGLFAMAKLVDFSPEKLTREPVVVIVPSIQPPPPEPESTPEPEPEPAPQVVRRPDPEPVAEPEPEPVRDPDKVWDVPE